MTRLPKKHKDRIALLALSLAPLDPAGIYDEQEIDAHLMQWIAALANHGGGVDHVTWRRALVDFGFLRRATDGAVYRLWEGSVQEALTEQARQLDPVAVIAETASEQHERRAKHAAMPPPQG